MMIDLHVHILPGLDDGPRGLGEALEMAAAYAEAGFGRLVATPHWVAGSVWAPEPEQVLERLQGLREAVADRGLGLEVAPGMEIALTSEIPALLKSGRVLGLNRGAYVLVELPFQRLPLGWERIFFAMTAQGHRVLLAHPERCDHLAAEPDLLRKMFEMDLGIQVNWKSLLGRYGENVRETAWAILEGGLAHCLATDGHRRADVIGLNFQGSRRELAARLGAKRAGILVEGNPGRVWAGAALETVPAMKRARNKGHGRRRLKWH